MKEPSLSQKQAQSFINKWLWRQGYWCLFKPDVRRNLVKQVPCVISCWRVGRYALEDLQDFCNSQLQKLCEAKVTEL